MLKWLMSSLLSLLTLIAISITTMLAIRTYKNRPDQHTKITESWVKWYRHERQDAFIKRAYRLSGSVLMRWRIIPIWRLRRTNPRWTAADDLVKTLFDNLTLQARHGSDKTQYEAIDELKSTIVTARLTFLYGELRKVEPELEDRLRRAGD
jgi:hypothetical protein